MILHHGHSARQPSSSGRHVRKKWAEKRDKTKSVSKTTPRSSVDKTVNLSPPGQVLRASKLQEIARKQSFLRTHPSFHSLPEDILKKFVDNAVIKDYKPAEVRRLILITNLITCVEKEVTNVGYCCILVLKYLGLNVNDPHHLKQCST